MSVKQAHAPQLEGELVGRGRRDGNRLFIQGSGQPRAELFAKGGNQFFLRVVNGEVVFQTDSGGRAHSLSLTQDGKTVPAQLVQ